ncbi:hypothetical protein NTJ56_13435 [Burkholderia contaminans]|uniref:hypothetical protein n=1 Tax=Burkholderia contaminans TaxID=488447 RepID=UPI001CF25C09|nr:hypothetical protein [Burkholderia contaminans]MCA7914522.1 hypothetical protein [Burkholderia contaminans]MCA8097213.1 hypothetical protein [Burkholderia contaminans]UUX36345.1 hypothetical protein NTJ56_13435 [Burkholderia contaminans]
MNSTDKKIWFPAKRYGWGWGLPVAWQGWVVLLLFVIGIVAVAAHFPPVRSPLGFAACIVALVAALTAVCWLKGEKPGWRGGREK